MADYPKVRRKDREATEVEFYKTMLAQTASCAISMVDANGNPYVNTNFFLYDDAEDIFYFHTAGNGYTRSILEHNNNVCISVSKIGRLYPAKKPVDFGTEYYSVTIFGNVTVVEDDAAILNFFTRFLRKYFSHISPAEYGPVDIRDAKRATVYKVAISNWTAKVHEVDKDYPGAVYYHDVNKQA